MYAKCYHSSQCSSARGPIQQARSAEQKSEERVKEQEVSGSPPDDRIANLKPSRRVQHTTLGRVKKGLKRLKMCSSEDVQLPESVQ